jgi:polyhydroxybutyrate depolymerase
MCKWPLLLLLLSGSLFATEGSIDTTYGFQLDGFERKVVVHVPPKEKGPAPLVVVLHGAGGTAYGASQKFGWLQKANKEGFIVAFGEALPLNTDASARFLTNPNVWSDGFHRPQGKVDDIGYLKRAINEVTTRHEVDPKKIYMTGFSNGASMTFRAGVELSELLAAIAPVSGHLWLEDPVPKRALSMLLITGDNDPINPLEGGETINPWMLKKEYKPPMNRSVEAWLKLVDIPAVDKQVEEKPDATYTRYGPNQRGLEVVYIVVKGQGHEWPGGIRALPELVTGPTVSDFNATDVIWNFFRTKTG